MIKNDSLGMSKKLNQNGTTNSHQNSKALFGITIKQILHKLSNELFHTHMRCESQPQIIVWAHISYEYEIIHSIIYEVSLVPQLR